MKRKKIITLVLLIAVALIVIGIVLTKKIGNKATRLERKDGIFVVPTMNDKLYADSSWCGTFQLVWNDMKNELVKKDIVFSPQIDMVRNLNKEDFKQTMISEDYYYKKYGKKTLKLKEEIENGIKEKFNQESDILESIKWNDNSEAYLFYAMLYRKFEFLQEFDKLKNDKFGNAYENIQYFGIDKNTKNSVGEQISVLYYNSKDDFAILVNTKTDDEVIFCKNPKGKNFNDIYINMNNKANKYTGSKSFEDIDEFKSPKLEIDILRNYEELTEKEFETANNDRVIITDAIQTIKFSLDEKGGEIKSEAAIDISTSSIGSFIKEKPRYFYLDDTFAIFLKEKDKDKPYFAGRIDDITKFQKND